MARKKTVPPHGKVDAKTGQLYAIFSYTDRQGRRKQKARKAADNDHVAELHKTMAEEFRAKGEDGLSVYKRTFADLAAHYTQYHVKAAIYAQDGRKISGFRQDICNVEHQIKVLVDHFGKMALRSITFEDIADFRDGLYKTKTRYGRPPSVSTVNHYLKRLRRLLGIATRKGWLLTNPFHGDRTLVTATAENERTRRLLPGEEEALLAQCVNETFQDEDGNSKIKHYKDMRCVLIAAIDTAMRRGELLGRLKKSQVDLAAGIITVTGQWGGTKDMRSRHVPITPRLKVELQQLFDATKDDPDGYVFEKQRCDKAFASICTYARVEGLHFHDLRHEGTFRILEAAGGNHALAMKITGHTQMKTFMRYINVDIKSVQNVGENLGVRMLPKVVEHQENELVN